MTAWWLPRHLLSTTSVHFCQSYPRNKGGIVLWPTVILNNTPWTIKSYANFIFRIILAQMDRSSNKLRRHIFAWWTCRFQLFCFTVAVCDELQRKLVWNLPPHLKYVVALPCESWIIIIFRYCTKPHSWLLSYIVLLNWMFECTPITVTQFKIGTKSIIKSKFYERRKVFISFFIHYVYAD